MASIHAELVYVPESHSPIHMRLMLPEGITVAGAIHHSGLLQRHPEVETLPTGIFGTPVPLTQVVKEGDRIEIYRLLLIDPKEKRRLRARQK